MPEIGTAWIGVGADTDKFDSQITKGVTDSFKKLGGVIAGAFAAEKVFGFFKDSALGAEEAAQANARLEQTLKNAGDATGEWAKRQSDLASALSLHTGVDDEVIKGGQAILGTFHGIADSAGTAGGAFDRATQAAVDMSATGFGSVESASTMLGKALENPMKGLTALGKVGVTFTEGQKDQIAAMMEANDVAGAQALILEAVEGQVGGVAAATATNSDKMAVAWGEVQESVGGLLLPVMEKLSGFMLDTLLPAVESLTAWVKDTALPAFDDLKGKVEEFIQALEDNKTKIEAVASVIGVILLPALVRAGVQFITAGAQAIIGGTMQAAGWVIAQGAAIVYQIVVGAIWLWLKVQWVLQGVWAVAGALVSAGAWVIMQAAAVAWKAVLFGIWLWDKVQWVLAGVRAVAGALLVVGGWVMMAVAAMANAVIIAAAWLIAMGPVGWVIAAVLAIVAIFVVLWVKCEAFRDFWKELWDKIVEWAKKAWEWIKESFSAAVDFIWGLIQGFIDFYIGVWTWLWETVSGAVKAAWDWITGVFQAAVDWIVGMVQGFISDVKRYFEGIKAVFDNVKQWVIDLKDKFVAKLKELKDKISGWITEVVDFFKGIPGKIGDIGKNIVTGIWDGIKGAGSWFKDKIMGWISDHIPGPIKSILGIASPSKLMADYGEEIAKGLAVGIEAKTEVVGDASLDMARAAAMPVSALQAAAAPSREAAPSGATYNITVNVDMDDLSQLRTLEDFLRMMETARVDTRRTQRSGAVVV